MGWGRDRKAAGRTGHEVRAGPVLTQKNTILPLQREE